MKSLSKTVRCKRCKSVVSESVLEEYKYSCDECDEDLYEFETYIVEAIEKEA